jgi:hypothetical protein
MQTSTRRLALRAAAKAALALTFLGGCGGVTLSEPTDDAGKSGPVQKEASASSDAQDRADASMLSDAFMPSETSMPSDAALACGPDVDAPSVACDPWGPPVPPEMASHVFDRREVA